MYNTSPHPNDHDYRAVIIIDSNAWNFLFSSQIDLNSEYLSEFKFIVTLEIHREMLELSKKNEKESLYSYYIHQIGFLEKPIAYFGFHDPDIPDDEQRVAGFGEGGFSSIHESEFLEENKKLIKNSKRGVYYGNEADLFIASRANGKQFILTEDNKKNGPLSKVSNIINVSQSKPMTMNEFKATLDDKT
ncbi:hypothetical protein [Serratia sp. NPDC087055]|uniref:hypothetical protein n=1 Tax=Serratia sp. NPDC087055 TaxID=3364516 RepID=UPI00384C34CE